MRRKSDADGHADGLPEAAIRSAASQRASPFPFDSHPL